MSTKRGAKAAIVLVVLAAGGWWLGRGAQRLTKDASINPAGYSSHDVSTATIDASLHRSRTTAAM
jgi:hypothetical protein